MKKKYYSIQFLRLLFCVSIINYHFFALFLKTTTLPHFFCRGYIGDEFFFMVSGFFVARAATKSENNSADWTIRYLWKRIKRIGIIYYSSWFLCFTGRRVIDYFVGREVNIIEKLINSIYELLFLEMFGFLKGEYSNNVSWFFSALLISIAIICPLICRYRRVYLLCVAPIVSLFALGGSSICYDYLFYPHMVISKIPILKGMIRAFLDINVGVFIFGITEVVREYELTKRMVLGMRIVAYTIWGSVFAYALFPFRSNFDSVSIQYDYVFTLLIAIALLLTFWVDEKTMSSGTVMERIADGFGRVSVYAFFGQPIVYSIGEWYFALPLGTCYKLIGLYLSVIIASLSLFFIERIVRKLLKGVTVYKTI